METLLQSTTSVKATVQAET